MSKPGRFIVIEGLEGAGKTTAIKTIQNFLNTLQITPILTREPGGTRIGERLRTIIKEKAPNERMAPRCELLMLYAARVQLLEEVILPALQAGQWVIADRFELSTYAYQGGGRGINDAVIDSLSAICLQGFQPDLIIYLDITPQKGLARVRKRGKFDRIEQESLDFFTNVSNRYHERLKTLPNVCIINANAPLYRVQSDIISHLTNFLL